MSHASDQRCHTFNSSPFSCKAPTYACARTCQSWQSYGKCQWNVEYVENRPIIIHKTSGNKHSLSKKLFSAALKPSDRQITVQGGKSFHFLIWCLLLHLLHYPASRLPHPAVLPAAGGELRPAGRAVGPAPQRAKCAVRKAPGDLGRFFWFTFLGFPQVLLAVHAAAAPSTSSLCQAGLGLWKLCRPCLGTAPNSHFPMAWRGRGQRAGRRMGRSKKWWE